MISDVDFLKHELKAGIGLHNPDFVKLCDVTANQIKDLPIKTVLDYGAGTGVYSMAYINKGYDVYSFEIFKAHREYIKENATKIKLISKPVTTDLLNFIETAEHMTDKELNKLFKMIQPNYILFSSTSEKTNVDEDWGHINIKEQTEWDNFFESKGYEKVKPLSYPTSWSKLYKLKNLHFLNGVN